MWNEYDVFIRVYRIRISICSCYCSPIPRIEAHFVWNDWNCTTFRSTNVCYSRRLLTSQYSVCPHKEELERTTIFTFPCHCSYPNVLPCPDVTVTEVSTATRTLRLHKVSIQRQVCHRVTSEGEVATFCVDYLQLTVAFWREDRHQYIKRWMKYVCIQCSPISAFWNVPRLRPFVLLLRATWIWRWFWNAGGMILTAEDPK